MRISLAGPLSVLDPIVIVFDTPGSTTFDPTIYSALGYTNYDVIAIGAGGGVGGGMVGIDPSSSINTVTTYGGEGGGGGLHRVKGFLEILTSSLNVTIGAAGSVGTDSPIPISGSRVPSTNGGDGGSSSFGVIAKATGGMGGKRSQSYDPSVDTHADGGDGGIGGISAIVTYSGTRYAGAKGGICGILSGYGHNNSDTNGEDGGVYQGPVQVGDSITYTDTGIIGLGGGGGAGGATHKSGLLLPEIEFPYATWGGKGSYNSDESLYSPGSAPYGFTLAGNIYAVKAGKAGGGKITPLNGSQARYGDSGVSGVVAIRLTAE